MRTCRLAICESMCVCVCVLFFLVLLCATKLVCEWCCFIFRKEIKSRQRSTVVEHCIDQTSCIDRIVFFVWIWWFYLEEYTFRFHLFPSPPFIQWANTKTYSNSTFQIGFFFNALVTKKENVRVCVCVFCSFNWLVYGLYYEFESRVAVSIVDRPTLGKRWWCGLKQKISLFCVRVYMCIGTRTCGLVCVCLPFGLLLYVDSNQIMFD